MLGNKIDVEESKRVVSIGEFNIMDKWTLTWFRSQTSEL